jgi:hypothetical protein
MLQTATVKHITPSLYLESIFVKNRAVTDGKFYIDIKAKNIDDKSN